MRCRACGCTDDNACPGGCFWVDAGLCSSCVPETRRALDLDDELDDVDGISGPGFTIDDGGDGGCPVNPLGAHQVLWTDGSSGYCVRCRTPIHA